jgi:hypothetical protein
MSHTCHWPGCQTPVLPAMWGCTRHWFALPKNIRTRIWQTYRPGQEISKEPSEPYIKATQAARDWIETEQAMTTLREQLESHSWWYSLTRKERIYWCLKSGSESPALAYLCFKASQGVSHVSHS